MCVCVCATGILIPVPAVVVAMATDGYITNLFPTVLCGPRNSDLWYFSAMFVINLLLIVGVSLLIITFWKVHKV